MDVEEVEKKYQLIISLINQQKVKDALGNLLQLIVMSQSGDLRMRYDEIDVTYRNILKYTIEGTPDPERPKIYDHMLISILELTDVVKHTIFTQRSGKEIYRMKHEFEKRLESVKEQAAESLSGLSFERELADVLRSTYVAKEENISDWSQRDKVLSNIFNLIWLTDKFLESDINLLQTIRKSENIPWYEKCIIVSALTMSLIRCFDKHKIIILIDYYADHEEQVWQRALVGLVLSLYLYDSRIHLYSDLRSRIDELQYKERVRKDVEMVAIQLLRSKETEKITKKLQEEIIPEVMKMAPKLEDKLDLNSLLSKDFQEDKNPEWEDFFKDTPDLYEKMEEFTHMQMEGSDVFWGAFAMLKHFDFFRVIHNWFLPFHKENQVILDIFNSEKENIDPFMFMDGISKMPYLCNSDKYSFCLNMRYLPPNQKTLLMDFFNAELKQMTDVTEEETLLNQLSVDKFIFTQYIQDLYRFFKLHPLRSEFTDIFGMPLDIHSTWFFTRLIDDPVILRNIAEFYFEKDHFEHAVGIYKSLNLKGDNSYEIYEKIGYCYQRLEQYELALEYFHRAELFDTPRAWLLKKIGLCYRHLKKYEDAIKYYEQVLEMEPDNLNVQTIIGQCHLDIKNYEQALACFYKVEYLTSSSVKARRPIAWINFITGKLDMARKYYLEIISQEPNKYDYMNLGHVEWSLGNKKSAVENYITSIRQKGNSLDLFLMGFMDDREYLINHGIEPNEISLLLDYLKYLVESAT
ncbi:MAG: tetratricopeptide repeat protein [Bacteroidetes bacterium]|nr:tetratricopeptide repeat protein [Bacteroidota bacterium]